MSEKEGLEVHAPTLRDFFEGIKGCQPQTDQELQDWLASPEGRVAVMFELPSMSRWGGIGRS